MIIFLQSLILILLFFVILPAVSISIVTVARLIFLKIKKKENIRGKRIVPAVIVAVIGILIIPPLPYVVADLALPENVITGNNGTMIFDDETDIRSIEINGEKYRELDRSISAVDDINLSEDSDIIFGDPFANVVYPDNQNLIEKYILKVFRYPTNSQIVYSVENDDLNDFILLEMESVFCSIDTIDDRISYYNDLNNYNYFAEDYNSGEFFEFPVDFESIQEISALAQKRYDSQYTELTVDPDYELITIIGESKDGLFLREFGEIYMDPDKNAYLFVDEDYADDGISVLITIPLSDKTSAGLQVIFKDLGIGG